MRKELEEQINLPLSEFKQKVKCCYNCVNWLRNRSEEWNACNVKNQVMPYDFYCNAYRGNATQSNLISAMTDAEVEELLAINDAAKYPPA